MHTETRSRVVYIYSTIGGHEPFTEWVAGVTDIRNRARIRRRVDRLAAGNPGDHKPVGEGVIELRLFFGPGYRIYLAEHGLNDVVILCGGDKSSQRLDIERAIGLWNEYKLRIE